ncbi:MAG: hypothetical protein WB779_09920 [Ignavibacteriaceae bacterium]|jgi:hypothetical protein
MIEYIRAKFAGHIINKTLKDKTAPNRSFTNLLRKCSSFFVIMPETENDFQKSKQVITFLEKHKKVISILTFDFRRNEFLQSHFRDIVEYGLVDYSKLNLPSPKLVDKLKSKEFDAVIDLNRAENLFCSFAANLVQSNLTIGFTKVDSDKFYNIQINDSEDNPEISYKNFINCLEMF